MPFRWCGYGRDLTKPPFMNLNPDKLKEITTENIEFFLRDSFPDSVVSNERFFFSISSTVDTIRFKTFKIIEDYFKSKKKRKYVVRRRTEEEEFVLDAKLANKPYDPYKQHWKTGFDGGMPLPKIETIYFIPPEVEEEKTDTLE